MKRKFTKEFTLLELLIVVAVIALLISILMPSLSKARDKAIRAVCLSNLSQCARVSAVYAANNNFILNYSSGINGINSLHWLGGTAIEGFEPYISSWKITDCPNWALKSLGKGTSPIIGRAQMTGFIYSGGLSTGNMKGSGQNWKPPQTMMDESNLMLWADRIETSKSYNARMPHTVSGYMNGPKRILNINPSNFGNKGGNIAYLDGSARWVEQKFMTGQKADTGRPINMWWKIEE